MTPASSVRAFISKYISLQLAVGIFILGVTTGAIWFAFIMLTALFATGKV